LRWPHMMPLQAQRGKWRCSRPPTAVAALPGNCTQ
jgi:hypothetical protein